MQLSVPSHCGRKALRAVVQQLLSLGDGDAPDFHFLVAVDTSGIPLRTTLGKFLVRHKLSSESVLHVTYYLPLPPPEKRSPEAPPLPSWLSCLSAHGGKLLAGSYCGAVSVDGELVTGAHAAPVKSVAWTNDGQHFLTVGQDECVRMWDGEKRAEVGVLRAEDVGACSSFEAVATAQGVAAAGAFDGSVWLLPQGDAPSQAIEAVRLGEATGLCVGSAVFDGPKSLFTGGWDGVVRAWDIVAASLSSVIPAGGRSVTGVCVAKSACVVSAVDGAVRVLDARGEQGVVAACKRRGAHNAAANDVACVAENAVVTGGADGEVKMWDLRAMNDPVHSMKHGDGNVNVLAVTGLDNVVIASAGSDGKIAKFDMRES